MAEAKFSSVLCIAKVGRCVNRAWIKTTLHSLALMLLAVVLIACGNKQVATAPVVAPMPLPTGGAGSTQLPNGQLNLETGIASWYGDPYHGRRSASGEVYDMEQLTAAHRTLPFHTWVEVTNLNNGRKVLVRINDRGPFVDGRIIDLSRAAAREIDSLIAGVVPVELRIVNDPLITAPAATISGQQLPGDPPVLSSTSAVYFVQAGAFVLREGAERITSRINDRLPGADARILTRNTASSGDQAVMYRVLVGDGLSRPEAASLAEQVALISGEAVVVAE